MIQITAIVLIIFSTINFNLNSVLADTCRGCLALDELNFDKVINKFEFAVIKFDVAYPYGDKHETFGQLAQELAPKQDLIFGDVGVKDYGERTNEKLAQRFEIGKDDLPAMKLFKNGNVVVNVSKDGTWSLDNLRELLRENTAGIYIGLPGCLEQFDEIARHFLNADDKAKRIDQVNTLIKQLENENDKRSAEKYLKFMKKILENGPEFVGNERKRVKKILKNTNNKLNDGKKQEFLQHLNILKSFTIVKDEL